MFQELSFFEATPYQQSQGFYLDLSRIQIWHRLSRLSIIITNQGLTLILNAIKIWIIS